MAYLTSEKGPEEIIRGMSIEDAYNTLILENNDENGTRVKLMSRYGITIPFDIYEWFYETIQIKEKKGYAIIKGKKYKLQDIWSEIEARNILIKNHLLSKITNKNIVSPRER